MGAFTTALSSFHLLTVRRLSAVASREEYTPTARPASMAAPRAVVSTIRGRSIGFWRISDWNCMRKLFAQAPPSTLREASLEPESFSINGDGDVLIKTEENCVLAHRIPKTFDTINFKAKIKNINMLRKLFKF